MAKASVATDVHQPLDVHLNFSTELPLDKELILNDATDFLGLVFRPALRLRAVIKVGALEDLPRPGSTDPVDRRQGDLCSLVGRDIYARNSCHRVLRFRALPD